MPPAMECGLHVHALKPGSPAATIEFFAGLVLAMRTIDLDSLEIFRTVVEEGGILRAAE
jgi:hypothetical protein